MKSTTPRVWWRLLTPLALLSLVLAACAGSPPSIAVQGSASAEAASSGASPAAAPPDAATAAPAETALAAVEPVLHPEVSGSITFWHFWSSAVRRTAIREVIGVCEQQLPQIKVREIAKPYGDIWTDNIAAVAAGTGMPDVIVEDRPQLPDRAINGIAQPISGLADRDGVDSAQFWPFTWNETLHDGQSYGVPFETDVRVLYYNKDAFREVGLDPERPPQTWAELEAYADKLDRKNPDGTYDRIAFFPMLRADPNIWGYANGVQWIDGDGNPLVNTPGAAAVIDWIKSWVDRYGGLDTIERFSKQFTSAPNDPFMTGHLAMFTDINGYSSQLKFYNPRVTGADGTGKPMDWGVARLPSNGASSSWSGGFALSIPRGAQYPEAAWEFIKCATGVRAQTVWARGTYSIPANIAAANDSDLLRDAKWRMFVDAMRTTSGSVFVATYPNWYEQLDMRYPAIWSGELSTAAALEEAQRVVDTELAKRR